MFRSKVVSVVMRTKGVFFSFKASRYGDGSKPCYLVNPKIAGKWMFIPLQMLLIGIDPYPFGDEKSMWCLRNGHSAPLSHWSWIPPSDRLDSLASTPAYLHHQHNSLRRQFVQPLAPGLEAEWVDYI